MTRMATRSSTIAAGVAMVAALSVSSSAAETLTLTGALSCRARIALPPRAVAVVEVRAGTEAWGTLVDEQRTDLQSRQVPVPFTLAIDREKLHAGQSYLLRGFVMAAGRILWATDAVRIDPASPKLAVGTLLMTSSAPAAGSLSAGGNEPGWNADIGTTLTLLADYGQLRVSIPTPTPEPVDGGRRYSGTADGHTVVLVVLDRPCSDTMSGMKRPKTVELTLDGRTMKGCGGPADAGAPARRP